MRGLEAQGHFSRTRLSDTRATLREGQAKLYQLKVSREISRDHSLDLLICKTSLYGGSLISSKLLPLVVAMWEEKGDERYHDFYSFDNNGVCLSHGYSRWKGDEKVVDEEHDTDIGRLIDNGRVIEEMMRRYSLPAKLAMHTTVIDLKNNVLRS